MKRSFLAIVVVGLAILLTACPPQPIRGVTITPETAAVAVGESVQLTARVQPPKASQLVMWASDAPAIASVGSNGLVRGESVGTAIITATSVGDPSYAASATVTVGAPAEGAGVVILTPDLLLLERGETFALAALAYDSAGGVVPDAVIGWSSSEPSVVSVDSDGVVTAEEVVGSVTITATWQGSTDSIHVLVALLTPDTVRIARADVVQVGPDYDTAVLARNPTTAALAVGDVFTSGEVLGRITGIRDEVDEIIVEFEPVGSLDEAFDLFYVHAISEVVAIEGSLSPAGLAFTTDLGGVRRSSFLQPELRCDASEWDSSVDWELIEGTYEFTLNVRTEFVHGLSTRGLKIDYEGSRAVLTGGPQWNIETPGILVKGAAQGALDCFASAGAFTIPMVGIPGIITLDGVVEPRLGFKAVMDASGHMRVTGPALRDGHVTFSLGFEHDPDDGLTWIHEADASLGAFEPFGDLSIGAAASVEAGPYLSISGGIGIKLLGRRWLSAEMHFAEPRLYLTLDGSLETPILRTQSGYKGLEWALQYGVQADLKVEVAGGVTAVLDFFDIPTTYGRRGMDIWGPVVWAESPTPSVAAELSHASALALRDTSPVVERSSGGPSAILFTSTVPERYAGDDVEFWGFADGATTCRWLTQSVVDAQGVASATWQPGPNDVGEYAVRAHLHSGVLGRINLPYPSSVTAPVTVGLPPIAVDDAVSFYKGLVLPVATIDVLANDSDPAGGRLRIIGVTQPAPGRGFVRHTDAIVSYELGHVDEYDTSFGYTIENEVGGRASATVSVSVGSLQAFDSTGASLPDLSDRGISGRINQLGDAIATSCDASWNCDTSVRRANGPFVVLGTLGGDSSAAMGLNDGGQAVGWSHNSEGRPRPFVWDAVGGIRELEPALVADVWGVAMAVNNSGHVVGAIWAPTYGIVGDRSVAASSSPAPKETPVVGKAVVWRDGVVIDLHAALESRLGMAGASIASGVIDSDPVPVVAGTFYPSPHLGLGPVAFTWTDRNANGLAEAGEIVVLPPLRAGDATRVTDVNQRGQVVGVSESSTGAPRPVLWDELGAVRELAQLAGGVAEPRGINVHGQIVGYQTAPDGSRKPMYWAGNARATPDDVLGMPEGWVLESLHDVNDRGDVVGAARTPDDTLRAILLRVGN